jgi:hypothetical protein
MSLLLLVAPVVSEEVQELQEMEARVQLVLQWVPEVLEAQVVQLIPEDSLVR